MKLKKNKIIILLLGIITFLGIIWLSNNNKIIEGNTPDISPASAKALTDSFKRQMKDAGIPAPKSDVTDQLFAELTDLINGEVNAATDKQKAIEKAASTSTSQTINTIQPKFIDKSFFIGNKFADAFCQINTGKNSNPTLLNNQCANLTAENCNATNCCIWQNGKKCVAGNAKGPTFINGVSSDADYYSYKYQCYGKCANQKIYNATSCHGWDCSIENQRCLSGTPGAGTSNWICKKNKWIAE